MPIEYSKPLVVFGLGPFAELMTHHFREDSAAQVVSFVADRRYITRDSLSGIPVTAFEDLANAFPPEDVDAFLAVGYRSMRTREALFNRMRHAGYRQVQFVSSRAVVPPGDLLGENCVVLGNAVIEPFCTIGDNNVFWSGAVLCHGTRVGHHNFFAAGSIVGGESTIGDRCFLGFGATVLERTRIADESLLGAMALVVRDTEPATKYLGIPARPVGIHVEGGIVIDR